MTDETRQPDWTPTPLPEQTREAGETGPLPDVPADASPPDAVPLDPPDLDHAADDGEDGDQAGDFTDPDVDLAAVLPGWDADPEEEA